MDMPKRGSIPCAHGHVSVEMNEAATAKPILFENSRPSWQGQRQSADATVAPLSRAYRRRSCPTSPVAGE